MYKCDDNNAKLRCSQSLSADWSLQDAQGDDITFPSRCSEKELWTPGYKQFTGAPSRWTSSPLSYAPSGKRLMVSRSKLARFKSSNLEIRSPDPVEVRILPVILHGGTLSRRQMRRNSPFTMINVTHLSSYLEKSMIIVFSSSCSFSFIWWKEEGWHGGPKKEEIRISK